MTSSKAKLGHEKLRNPCQLEVVQIRFHKFLGNFECSFFLPFFSLKSECAGVSGWVSKEVFVLGWSWGAGYLWFTAICSQSFLWSWGRAYFPAIHSALEPCAPYRLPSCVRHIAFPQTAHHPTPIILYLAVTEGKGELQLLSASYTLQVTK